MSKPKKIPTPVTPQPDDVAKNMQEISVPLTEIEEIEMADATTKEEGKLIEPHAPHHPVTTWKEVFIHIGIVTVGLLIALSLEQTVEYFHHRHQVAEIRESLRHERQINVIRFKMQTEEFYRFVPVLKMNLAIFVYLREHPGAPPEKWPGKFHWYSARPNYADSVWKTAQESNVLQFMPQVEVRKYSELYESLKNLNDLNYSALLAKRDAYRYYILDPDASHMSTQQLDREIELTSQALFLFTVCATTQSNLSMSRSDFSPSPTKDDVNKLFNNIFSPDEMKQVLDQVNRTKSKESALDIEELTDETDKSK